VPFSSAEAALHTPVDAWALFLPAMAGKKEKNIETNWSWCSSIFLPGLPKEP
jgi:hypothetical protein